MPEEELLQNLNKKINALADDLEELKYVVSKKTGSGSNDVKGTITKSLVTASKYQTYPIDNKGIKIFTEPPDVINKDTGIYLPTVDNEPAAPYNGAEWTNPENAYTSDGNYATAVQGDFKYSIWRSFSYLQTAIPDGATITGITVKCYAKADIIGSSPALDIYLTKNGADVVGTSKRTGILTTSDTLVYAGRNDELWGTTWEKSDFGSTFGVMISGSVSATPSITYSIDYIQVIVHYTESFADAEAFIEFWNEVNQNALLYFKKNTSDLYIDKANLYLKGGLTVAPTKVIIGNTGAKLPTANAEPASPFNGVMWTNPTYAYTNNSAYATAVTTQRFTIWKTFDLLDLIPGGAIITGIQVNVEGKVSSSTGTITAYLTKDGSTVVGSSRTSANFTTSDSVVALGDSGDVWGTTWTKGDFNEDFGVMINQDTVSAVTYSIDYIQITVYYTLTTDNAIDGNIIPTVDDVYDLGSSTKRYSTAYARRIIAENVTVDSSEVTTFDNLLVKGFSVSANLRNSNDDQKTTTSTTYVKLKECLLNEDLPACTLKFRLISNGGGGDAYGQIYKNGVAIGTEQIVVDPTTFSENFTGFVRNDLIQIYGKKPTGTGNTAIDNMGFYYDYNITKIGLETLTTPWEVTEIPISITNQDP